VPPFVVAIPAGPAPEEAERVADLLASLRAHEPRAGRVLLIDDAPAQRRAWPQDVDVIPNPRRGRGIGTLGGTCAATLAALAWTHEHEPGAWCLRLDTDALVIGPFAEAVDAALAPEVGVLGSCRRTCNGEPRDLSSWAPVVRRHARRLWLWRHPPRRWLAVQPAIGDVRRTVRAALARDYEPGEHCIAAACAIGPALIAGLAAAGTLAHPRRWLNTRFGDDVMLGVQARALGLELRDLHAVFGLRHVGLPDTPQRLADRGFALIHSVRNDPAHDEPEVRAFFAARRARTGAGSPS
jgi:hypothetical protein